MKIKRPRFTISKHLMKTTRKLLAYRILLIACSIIGLNFGLNAQTTTITNLSATNFTCGSPANLTVTFVASGGHTDGVGGAGPFFVVEFSDDNFATDPIVSVPTTLLTGDNGGNPQMATISMSSVQGTNLSVRINSTETTTANVFGTTINSSQLDLPTSSVSGSFCLGGALSVNFLAGFGYNPDNLFQLELVGGSGNRIIGTLPSIGGNGTILATIPYDIPIGGSYSVRIVSTSPAGISCNSSSFTVLGGGLLPFADQPDDDQMDLCLEGDASWTATPSAAATSSEWYKICLDSFFLTLRDTSVLPSDAINGIETFNNGFNNFVYLATGEGLVVLDKNNLTWQTFTIGDNLPSNQINDVFVDQTNARLFVATNKGFAYTDNMSGGGFNPITEPQIANELVYDIFADGDNVWVATPNNLSYVDLSNSSNNIPELIPNSNPGGIINVSSVYGESVGTSSQVIFAGTPTGLSRSIAGTNVFLPPIDVDDMPVSSSFKIINDVYVDAAGNIFVATAKGVSYSTNGGANWTRIRDGLADDAVSSIYTFGNMIFAGTSDGLGVAFIGNTAFTNYDFLSGMGYGDPSPVLAVKIINNGGNPEVLAGSFNGYSNGVLNIMGTGNTVAGNFPNTLNLDDLEAEDFLCRYFLRSTNGGCTAESNIVKLGDLPRTPIATKIIPSPKCGSALGSVTIGGLVPGAKYILNHTSMSTGTTGSENGAEFTVGRADSAITINFLDTGEIKISITSLEGAMCTSDTLTVDVPGPDLPTFAFDPSQVQEVNTCENTALLIDMPELADGQRYAWFTDEDLTMPANPRTTEEDFRPSPPPSDNDDDYWVIIQDRNTECTSADTAMFDFTIGEKPVLEVNKINPDQPGGTGSLLIGGLSAGTYMLHYISPTGNLVSTSITINTDNEVFEISGLAPGPYNGIYVVASNGCESNRVSCPIFPGDYEEPTDNFRDGPVFTIDTICGLQSGFFQKADPEVPCTGNNTHFESIFPTIDTNGIVVGRVRNPEAIIPDDPTEPVIYTESDIEFKGWVIYDLFSMLPKNAFIDKIEYAASAHDTYNDMLCEVPLESATGDIQFDVTRLDSFNYGPYLLFNEEAYNDIANQKYADFTIAGEQQGAWTDLGPQAVKDMQARLEKDGKFQVGITLSGGDFDVPVYRFHGIIFKPGTEHKLRITYHQRDYGDLPEPKYTSDLAGGIEGAYHRMDSVDIAPSRDEINLQPSMYIGETPPDAEKDANRSPKADGDDMTDTSPSSDIDDDEDLTEDIFVDANGAPTPLIAGEQVYAEIPVRNNLPLQAYVYLFIDFNNDGDFDDEGETQIDIVGTTSLIDPPPATGLDTAEFSFIAPDIAQSDTVAVRVRISSAQFLDANGMAPNGEVEDFFVELRAREFGDLDDLTTGVGPNDFQTLEETNGARHGVPVIPLVYLGELIDTEADGQPSEEGEGDDTDSLADDEDGIVFLTPFVPGKQASIAYRATNATVAPARLYVFGDLNNDGTLDSLSQADISMGTNSATATILTFDVPEDATFDQGRAFFRFRITTDTALLNNSPTPLGLAEDGEVEDYFVPIFKIGSLVWEDRNNNGFQDEEEINLGIDDNRVVLRFGGIVATSGAFDEVNQNTIFDPNTPAISGVNGDLVQDFVCDTLTADNGTYAFTGLIEGKYQLIAVDSFNLTPTRPDWIDNVTEEDRDSDGIPLEEPWDYEENEIRQAKSQVFTLNRDSVGTDEEGILDQQNPKLQDPNQLIPFPDNRVEQRVDFGYTAFDFGDLRGEGDEMFITEENETIENGFNRSGLFPTDTVLIANEDEGPKHIVTPEVYLGSCADAEEEGQPDFDAGQEFAIMMHPRDMPGALPDGRGDDPNDSGWNTTDRNDTLNCVDDENGVKFMTPLIPGYKAIIDVDFYSTINFDGPDAYLQAYIDWNGDNDFYIDGNPNSGIDPNEHIIFTYLNDDTLLLEPNTYAVELEMYQREVHRPIRLTFNVPADAKMNDGNLLARFRIGKVPNLGPTGILPSNLNFPDGVVPVGEVEDYFMKLSKVGNIVWEDRDYDGIQDLDEPVLAGVKITLDFHGIDTILNGDFYENTYETVTDENGKYYFCGLIGSVDPSGIEKPSYTLTAFDPDNMTPTVNRDTFPSGLVSNCVYYNSDGNDDDIDDRISAVFFRILNPMGLCQWELHPKGINDMRDSLVMDMDDIVNNRSKEDNIWPDMQIDETLDFGFVGMDYGDLPDSTLTESDEYQFWTQRDWLPGDPTDFGARHAIQPRLYLGDGVDGELNGQPDLDAGSKAGGDDDFAGEDPVRFYQGTENADDENGIRLLTPLLPGEYAYIRVNYTAQDTTLNDVDGTDDGYVNLDAFLNAFVDWNGDGDYYVDRNVIPKILDTSEKIVFTHQGDDPENLDALAIPTDNPILPGGVDTFQILGFRVPDTSITDFNEGRAFMRFRLSFEGNLDPDNYRYHKDSPHHVRFDYTDNDNDPVPDTAGLNNPAFNWTWAQGGTPELTYPRGEVEDYSVPLAKIGNLAWYDHNVNGRQDPADALGALYNTYVDEYGVDTLHLVLIWGGVDDETGAFDTVGYQGTDMMSLGAVTDIRYNLSIAPQLELPSGDGTYDPDDIIKTTIDGLYSFRGLIPGTYNLIPLKYLQEDSTDFVNFWPKHRVLTVKNNEEMSDSLDSDAGPGAVFTINDINTAKDPEVCVGDLPTGEDGQLDMTLDLNDPFFPDTLYDQTIDFGWVDEPNIEANLDLVGVDFPTSEICGHFNVIYHLCLKNPTETPLDSIVPFLNIAKGYGAGFYSATKPEVSIIEQSYLSGKEAAEKGLDYCEPHRKAQSGSVDSLSRYINGGYDGLNDTLLLTGGDSESGYFLPGDSVICIRIEFEVNPEFYNPTPQNPCPWMLRGGSYARAVGFEYDADQSEPWLGGAKKTRLIDWRTKNDPAGTINPRFGHHIQVYDLSDEYDDNAYRAIGGKRVADHIRFEGFVMDRGDRGEYKVFELKSLTGRDKYLDEDDYTVQDDECWEKTKNLSGVDNVFATLDENCEIKLIPEMFITNYDKDCGFGAYPEGSYYRVIIQDEHTGETLWSSADRVPFDGSKYFGRKLIYKARSVANFCEVIWGRLTLEDKLAPVVECLPDTDKPLLYPGRFVCSDIDSILNVSASWEDDEYRYYTGVASATDNCGEAILERVSDVVRYFNDCVEGGNQLYAYPYAIITRTFLFKDDYGNESLCMQEIYIHRPEIYLPECKVFLNAKEVGSDETLSLADLVNTYEQELSVPFYKNAVGDTIYLSEANACGFGITYEDVGPFQKGDCGFKLERKWAIVDWCYGQGGSDYPDYFIEPEEDGDCYQSGGYNGNVYEFTQLLEVGDKLAPIVGIPDLDRDGFAGVNGYQDGPIADPELSTGSYDAEDVFEYPTGTDCAADFIVNKELFNVKEHGNWCFDVDVVVRQPVLDFDERPKPGEFEFVNDPGIRISGDCESGYWVSDAPMVLDTTKYYFLEGYFYDDCNNDTTVYIPFVVVDSTPPVMICDDAIRVTYDNLGRGSLAAVDVDEGTTDNCNKILWLKVRRPVLDCEDSFQSLPEYVDENNNNIIDRGDWIDENGNNRRDTLEYFVKVLADNGVDSILMSPLLDEVPFFCCDPDSVKVELWASDKSGNRSNCWQYALLENRPPIQYELPGNYILPDNAQYNCEEEEDKVVLLTSGGIYSQGSLTYRAAVDLLGGDLFIVQDNTCSGFIQEMEVLPTLDQCGFGYIDVRWILTTGAPLPEPHNEESVITEWRRIKIVEKHDYWIKFPKDVYTNCTSPSPDTIEVSSDACDLMAIARLPDERFSTPQDPDVCYKIFRTYRVINWCEYDGQQDPVVVSRDWDRWNGSDLGTFTLNDDGDFDNVREYNLNPRNPEGDDIPGNTDLYVIVQRDFNDGRVDRVYYDADPDPTEDLQIQFYGDGSPVSTEHPNFIPGTGTRDLAGQDAETYWWQVTSGGFERRRSNGTTYYEGYGPSDERYYEGTYRQSWDQPNSGGSSVRPSSPERYLPVMWANDGNANNADPNGSTNGSGDNDDNDYSYGSVGFWQYTQHILVYDEEDPELTVDLADTYPSLSNVDCAGEVVVPINALDLCNGDTTNVLIRVIVDGEDVSSQYDAGSGVYSDRLGLGKHDLIVTARDACGNVATFRDEIEVVDGKGPSPIIRNDLVIELGRDEADSTGGGSATIWADDFVLSPIYDCTGQDGSEVDENGNARVTEYSINLVGDSAQIDQKGLSFDCEDVGALIEVEIHAWDGAGNHDYAVTTVIVQDNLGACDQEAGAGSIAGAIATQDDNRVNEVEVRLSGADQRMYMTNATGTYAFTELVEDSDYTVIPEKNDFHNNGISTFDVILMQKHILGTGLLESPYDQIAADINRSGTITTLDLIQLRKMILAIDTEFADNTSWRFVDADYVFSNNPLTDAFPEVKNINNLLGAEEANFIAIKIGDLNGSAAAYVQPRSQTERLSLEARMSEAHLEAGREYRIGIRAKDESLVQGYQFSLELKEVAIVDVIYGQLEEEHVGMFSKDGILTVSWNGEGVGEELMSIIVRPSTGLAAQDVIRLSSTKTEVEAYNDRDEIMGIDLSIGIDEGMRLSNELYQNVPNPFKGETQIGFRLGEASRAVLKIRDVQGRLIKQIEGEYGIGEHQIRLKEEELPSAGVYYYSLEAGDYTATKKLILIDSASR